MREDARLIVIYVSDEDDQSDGGLPYYVDFLRNIHGARNVDLLTVSIIVGLDGNPPKPKSCSSSDGDASAGSRYYEVYDQINAGLAISICDGNWGSALQALGIDTFVSRVQFPLSRQADPSTLQVLVNNSPLPQDTSGSNFGWTYDEGSNSIVFGSSSVPPRGASIKVSYEAICL